MGDIVWIVDSIYGGADSDLVLVGWLAGPRRSREVDPVIESDLMDRTPPGSDPCVNVISLWCLNSLIQGRGASLHLMCFKSDPQNI